MQNNLSGNTSLTTDTNTPQLLALSGGSLLDCAQAAHYLNVSESYVRKKVGANAIPYFRLGTRVLFRKSELDSWLDRHAIATNSEVSQRAEGIAATALLRKGRA